MSSPYLAADVLGSVFEILGTFLLAVEAIKVKNLSWVRGNVLGRIRNLLLPKIYVAEGEPTEVTEKRLKVASARAHLALTFIGFSIFFVTLTTVTGSPVSLWEGLIAFVYQADSTWHKVFLGCAAFVLMFFWSGIVGLISYKVALLPFRVSIGLFEWIENNAANGVIGVLGFLMFLSGALVQIYLKIVAA